MHDASSTGIDRKGIIMNKFQEIGKSQLERFREADLEIDRNLMEQERLIVVAHGCGAMEINDRVQSSPTGDSMEKAIAMLMEKQRACSEEVLKWLEVKEETIDRLKELESPVHRTILYMKYAKRMRLKEIAAYLDVSLDSVKHWHIAALGEFGKVCTK